jgi:uncharacterized glyoxalase superfamily protein PhnB
VSQAKQCLQYLLTELDTQCSDAISLYQRIVEFENQQRQQQQQQYRL